MEIVRRGAKGVSKRRKSKQKRQFCSAQQLLSDLGEKKTSTKNRGVKIGNLRFVCICVLMLFMSKKKEKIKESDLRGFKYFKTFSQMLERLHNAGCQRDRVSNRILHVDQYMTLLLCMFSPISKSLRSMQQVGCGFRPSPRLPVAVLGTPP